MKLLYRIISRLSVILIIVLSIWAALFYVAIMDEINDEVDDSLEDYSEQIIVRALVGEELPSENSGSNNQYFLTAITDDYARITPHIVYKDSMVYIAQKRETEPARILSTIFKDDTGNYYELVVSTPSIEKDDLKESILYWIIFLYISLLLIIILVNIWVYYRSTRPLYVLLKWMDNYKVGSKNEKLVNDTEITEFRKLNKSAIDTMERAELIYEKQKQFIGNASHEIQTPLAVSLNRLEILMEDETLSEKQLEELHKTQQTLNYITRLNKSLLLLSKIDSRQFQGGSEVEINTILNGFLQDYQEVYSHRHIGVEVEEEGIFKVKMNDSLAAIMLNNLLKNSYVHNVENGHIRIQITSTHIIFKNTGRQQPLDGDRIFDRFYQGSKKEGSTGLGLAIVKSICEMENLNIRYFYNDDEHCFMISR